MGGQPAKIRPTVDDPAKEPGRLFRVINGRVGFVVVPVHAGGLNGLGQHRLTIDQPAQRRGIKGAEGMEGVFLNPRPLDGCVQTC